jgi:predicted nucleic acid-binding protein
MKYVVDASVGLKWLLTEADSDRARQLRDDCRAGTHELLAPELFTTEIGNALLMAERRGRIGRGDGAALLADLLTCLPRLRSARMRLLTRAYEIAEQTQRTIYDCLYVALAEREQCEFVTADMRLVNSVQPLCQFVIDLSSLP